MTTFSRSILLAAAFAAFTSTSYATIIAPGGAVLAVPVAVSGSAVTGDTNFLPFTGEDSNHIPVFSGFELTAVYSGDTNNPLGGLTFVYEFLNNQTSPDAIDRLTVSGFTGFNTDVGFSSANGGIAPVVVTRSGDGNVIGFDFSSLGFPNQDVPPNGFSAALIVRTDAVADTATTMTLIDGGSGSVASFSPAAGSGRTPEPASLAILGLGTCALLRRRRNA